MAVALEWRDKLVGCVQPAPVTIDKLCELIHHCFDTFAVTHETMALVSFSLLVTFNRIGALPKRLR